MSSTDDMQESNDNIPSSGTNSLDRLLTTLVSCRPDVVPSGRRHSWMEAAKEQLQRNDKGQARITLIQWKGYACRSRHAHHRLALLFCTGLENDLNLYGSYNNDDDIPDVAVECWEGLLHALVGAQSPGLVYQVAQQLIAPSRNETTQEETCTTTVLQKLAETQAQALESGSSTTVVPALVLAAVLSNKSSEESNNAYASRLVSWSVQSFGTVTLAQEWLRQNSNLTLWAAIVLPPLLLKLKSHPDKALETIQSWIPKFLSSTNFSLPLPSDEWTAAVLKQLQSQKAENRLRSIAILDAWTRSCDECLLAWTQALVTAKWALAPARLDLWQALVTWGRRRTPPTTSGDANNTGSISLERISAVVEGLRTLVTKETTHKVLAWQATTTWYVALRVLGANEDTLESSMKPLGQTLAKEGLAAAENGVVVLSSMYYCAGAAAPAGSNKNLSNMTVAAALAPLWAKPLQKLVEQASSKKPEPGIYAVYWTLLDGSDNASKKLPTWMNKVFAATTSVLYASATTTSVDSVIWADCLAAAQVRGGAIFPKANPALVNCWITASAASSASKGALSEARVKANSTTVSFLNGLDRILLAVDTKPKQVAESLLQTLWERVSTLCTEHEVWVKQQNATRQARENEVPSGSGRPILPKDWGLLRAATQRLMQELINGKGKQKPEQTKLLSHSWVLSHMGSTLRLSGSHRKALVEFTTGCLYSCSNNESANDKDCMLLSVQQILDLVFDVDTEGTEMIHRSTLSLWTTLGQVVASAAALDFEDEDENDGNRKTEVADRVRSASVAAQSIIRSVATLIATKLKETTVQIVGLTEHDMAIYSCASGVPYRGGKDGSASGVHEKKKHLSEEEKWEEEMKKELAAKKRQGGGGSDALSDEDKALLAVQSEQRIRIKKQLSDLRRCLEMIKSICASDIEVGNEALVVFASDVLRLSSVRDCAALQRSRDILILMYDTLNTMATCVYEVDETLAPQMGQAMILATKRYISPSPNPAAPTVLPLDFVGLPSPCPQAAAVLEEIDQFGDVLSGPSFAFLFPIVRAALTGPRTLPGCECALRILGRHAEMLHGDDFDKVVGSLRKDMAISVLELLRHDRSQTFEDPTGFEVLEDCFKTDNSGGSENSLKITTAELAPLLDDRGALGAKNCRIGAMRALGEIASTNRKFVKNNPLAENRVWLNCFDQDEDVMSQARRTWATIHESDDNILSRPSPLYAPPLIPLLSSKDSSIADAASKAYAHALGQHKATSSRNLENLCKTYIEAYPTSGSSASTASESSSGRSSTKALSQTKKAPIATGLPKKKAPTKKSALAIAGIGKPKAGGAKKKPISSAATKALMKPKEERKLDTASMEEQFLSPSAKTDEEKDSPAKVAVRLGILRTLSATTTATVSIELDQSILKQITSFLIAYGIAETDETVKTSARNTFRDIVATFAGTDEAVSFLLPNLESVLKSGVADESALGSLTAAKVPRDVAASDRRKEGAVVALGSVALHLKGPENEAKVDATIDMLITTLQTPSEDVQASVADALTKLMKKGRTQERIETIVSSLLRDCLHGGSLATRRGSAYGLSAAVKGSGIGTLKKFDVVKSLEDAFETGNSNNKEGALFAIELMSSRLKLLFEPYVIVLLPSLLKSFSDGSDFVRKSASHTAGLIMSKLSAHGVKLVTPAVLGAFNDPAWRTKEASIRMLGAMSHLAPKQLAAALPKVVPQLIEAFSDTHPKVKSSAQDALDEISTVIRNPEIKSISPTLLKALTDPADHTQRALEELISTEFVHAIDAPSLSLIVPILHRGLRDRGATVKRMGGLIAGNICTMINDPRDFVPYLFTMLPDLQLALLDPIPDVRNTSAKAIGSLTRSLGDQILPELRPWLLTKLRASECSSSERSGAAQGLTEVLLASGTETIEEVMRDEILPLRSHPEPSTREGVIWMLTFLPPALGQGFTPLIDPSLPALVGGLSDESELVRDVAMRAGKVLIKNNGKVHHDKILPSLEHGLSDDDYRIRVASLSLLGDLLSMIGGTTVLKGDGDTQDDVRKAERAQAQIALVLGAETRKRVLSGLYLARSDAVHAVRHSAIQVWKTVVSVTARTLRDILPVLVSRIIENLASGNEERTILGGQCLGDIVGKLGDSVLPQVIPVLRNTLYEGNEQTKRGVCLGLNEVIKCSTKEQIIKYINIIIKLLQDALSDADEDVRNMAASSFQSMHNIVGNRAFDEVVPSLMVALEHSDDETTRVGALRGLIGILTVRSRELLPYIVPRLIQRPISAYHADALAGIAKVTGKSIYSLFGQIIPALLTDIAEGTPGERLDKVKEAAKSICAHVDPLGLNVLVSEIASKCPHDKPTMRREACGLFGLLVIERREKADFYDQIPIMIRELLYRLNDDEKAVLLAANSAFSALSKHVAAEELVKSVEFMRNLLSSMVSDARRRKGGVGDGEFLLPGFNIPKGVDPLLPIYQRGILYGNPTIREVSASGLGEVLSITSSKFLAGPILVKMVGPLLRVVGDRNPSGVKVAILKTLGQGILVKGGPALRAFVPQFQTTFVKALSDPSRQVRVEAIHALSLLMPLSTRVDPLLKELVAGALGKNTGVEGVAVIAVQTATLEALSAVLLKGGQKAKLPASIPSALDAAKELLYSNDQGIREAAAKVLGAACALLGAEVASEFIQEEILSTSFKTASVEEQHGGLCAIRWVLVSQVGNDLANMTDPLRSLILDVMDNQNETSAVREAACVALGATVGRSENKASSLKSSQGRILRVLDNSRETIEIHRAMATGLAVSLTLVNPTERVELMGLTLLDACLKLALTGTQRVQFAINDVLWLALDVGQGTEGLERYCNMAVFDNQRSMKTLHSRVLTRIKGVTLT